MAISETTLDANQQRKRLVKNKHYIADWCKQKQVGRW